MQIWLQKIELMKEFGATNGSNHCRYSSCDYVFTCEAVG
jgi:hypothetical protein